MIDYTPEQQALVDEFRSELEKAMMTALTTGPVPQTDEGWKVLRKAYREAYEKVFPDYVFTVEPVTDEDRKQRIARITIALPRSITMTVEVEK